jgi:2Fe-2S ferredoxin
MPTVIFTLADGQRREAEIAEGTSIMQGAVDGNIPGIDGECGGSLECGTCHVRVGPEWSDLLPAISATENELLDGVAAGRETGSRLSCQIPMTAALNGIVVRVPERQS